MNTPDPAAVATLRAHIAKYLEIVPIRPRVISQPVKEDLTELMRFRHFRRYYFGTACDWERLDALLVRCNRVHPTLLSELRLFSGFLDTLLEE